MVSSKGSKSTWKYKHLCNCCFKVMMNYGTLWYWSSLYGYDITASEISTWRTNNKWWMTTRDPHYITKAIYTTLCMYTATFMSDCRQLNSSLLDRWPIFCYWSPISTPVGIFGQGNLDQLYSNVLEQHYSFHNTADRHLVDILTKIKMVSFKFEEVGYKKMTRYQVTKEDSWCGSLYVLCLNMQLTGCTKGRWLFPPWLPWQDM